VDITILRHPLVLSNFLIFLVMCPAWYFPGTYKDFAFRESKK